MSNNIKRALISGLMISVLSLGGCASRDGHIAKSDVGTAVGAFSGAWIGSNVGKGKGNIAAIAAGTLLGAALGHELGASLDRADRAYLAQTTQQSLESEPIGRTTTWRNPDSGNYGTVTPVKTYQEPTSGRYCREYTQTIYVGGKRQEGYGTACREEDGSWQVTS